MSKEVKIACSVDISEENIIFPTPFEGWFTVFSLSPK